MSRYRTQSLALILLIPVVLVVCSVVYQLGMAALEGESRTFLESLEWAAETLTTTGYGRDANWSHPAMVLFVVAAQFAGVFLVFLVIPIFLIPFLESRFETRLPRGVKDVKDHVVIYGYDAAVAALLRQLAQGGVKTVVVDPDEAEARSLQEAGHNVVLGQLEDGVLERVCLLQARFLITNTSDEEDAAVVLEARHIGFEGEIFALVEEPMHRRPVSLAGATAVFTPRHMLGAALAARASRRINPGVSGLNHLGSHAVIREVLVMPESALAGKSLREAGIGARTGVAVIGQWVQGRLVTQPTPEMTLVPRGVLVVVGTEESIKNLEGLASGAVALRRDGVFVICGYGEVGRKVAQLLQDVGEEVLVVDRQSMEGVDLIGDVLDLQLLEKAGIRDAQAVIVALDNDSASLFAAVILKDLAPEVPVIARVNRAGNVERTHRAGADFALSISQVSAQVLSGRMLGEESVSILPQLKVKRLEVQGLAGKRLAALDLRKRTGCSVVAVERAGGEMVSVDSDFHFQEGDVLFVCGHGKDVDRFSDVF